MKTTQLLTVTFVTLVCFCLTSTGDLTPEQIARRQRRRERKKNRQCGQVAGVQSNITALWDKVNMLSTPVHVHIHGADVDSEDVDVMGMETSKHGHHQHGNRKKAKKMMRRKRKMMRRMKKAKSRGANGNCSPERLTKCMPEFHSDRPDLADLCPALGKTIRCMRDACPSMDAPAIDVKLFEEKAKLCKANGYVFARGTFDNLEEYMDYDDDSDEDDDDDDSDEDDDDDHHHHDHDEEDDDEEEMFEGGPNIHIHLNMAGMTMKPKSDKTTGFDDFEYPANDYVYARCEVRPNAAYSSAHQVQGTIQFRQKPGTDLEMKIDLDGFSGTKPGAPVMYHGFHLHEFADFSNGCNTFGGHYNPHGVEHGGRESHHRHVGDFGNLESDHTGTVRTVIQEKTSTLFGPFSIAGRGIVIHEGADDHGMGGTDSSKSSGNAGSRIACCAVTYAKGGW